MSEDPEKERFRKALEQLASSRIPVEFGPGDVVMMGVDSDVANFAEEALRPARPDLEADGANL